MPPHNQENLNIQNQVSFGEAFRFWLKLGFISFGGPAGQIAVMHRELVENRRWLSEERFIHALNYCMLLPGPEAQQLAIYIGWLMHSVRGAIVAGVFFVLPSVFILLALSYLYAVYGNVSAVSAVLNGFKPVVVAIVVEAVIKLGKRSMKRSFHFLIAVIAFVGITILQVPFPFVVLAAGVFGLVGSRFWPDVVAVGGNDEMETRRPPVMLVDDSPRPEHTLPSRLRVVRVLTVGLILWIIPFLAVIALSGWHSLHAQEYRFFSTAALVTFGGAYAVLGYVTQTMVATYGWITQAQAVDGLALAETTPGPLIMVLQFIGFMAVWNNLDGEYRLFYSILAALITTYVTFLPSFIFILVGAPYIESLRGNKNLTGALGGITAAIVGVILNLAIVFGIAVLLPNGISGRFDVFAVGLTLASFVALYFKVNVLWVVLGGGLSGLVKLIFQGT